MILKKFSKCNFNLRYLSETSLLFLIKNIFNIGIKRFDNKVFSCNTILIIIVDSYCKGTLKLYFSKSVSFFSSSVYATSSLLVLSSLWKPFRISDAVFFRYDWFVLVSAMIFTFSISMSIDFKSLFPFTPDLFFFLLFISDLYLIRCCWL